MSFQHTTPQPTSHVTTTSTTTSQFTMPLPRCIPCPPHLTSTPTTHCLSTPPPSPYASTWYTHPSAPNYLICSRCHKDHILPSPLSPLFIPTFQDSPTDRLCSFSTPRCRGLFARAAAGGVPEMESLLEYLRRRATLPPCSGSSGVQGSQKAREEGRCTWYIPTPQDTIPGFVVCAACHCDHVLASPAWSTNWTLHTQQQPDGTIWGCKFAIPYVRRIYHDFAAAEGKGKCVGWLNWVEETKARMVMPSCPRDKEVKDADLEKDGPSRFFVLKKRLLESTLGGPGMREVEFCLSCYTDFFNLTSHAAKFDEIEPPFSTRGMSSYERVKMRAQVDAAIAARGPRRSKHGCCVGKNPISIAVVLNQIVVEKRDYSVFWRSAPRALEWPECVSSGVKGTKWWTVSSNPGYFQICGRCYDGLLVPYGAGTWFVEKTAGSDMVLVCSLCPGGQENRVEAVAGMLSACLAYGTVEPLMKMFEAFGGAPPCPKVDALLDEAYKKPAEGRRWWGFDNVAACEECWNSFAKDTWIATSNTMKLNGEISTDTRVCDLYSPRMRALWTTASSRHDTSEMLAFAGPRRLVLGEAYQGISRIRMKQAMDVQKQIQTGIIGISMTMMGNSEAMGDAWNYGSGREEWRNDAVGGGFDNKSQLQGATFSAQARDMHFSNQSGMMGDVMGIQQYLMKWAAVE